MIVKNKQNCTIIIFDRTELGINSAPFLRSTISEENEIESEIHILMSVHGMSHEEAIKTNKENTEWAM